jgi:hypothetical protein
MILGSTHTETGRDLMESLTVRLATGEHPVIVGGPRPSATDLQSRIAEFGLVHVKFTETRGGTELGIPLDQAACDFENADFENARGTVHLEGVLTLDYDRVRCVADIDLETLRGTGHLVLVPDPV